MINTCDDRKSTTVLQLAVVAILLLVFMALCAWTRRERSSAADSSSPEDHFLRVKMTECGRAGQPMMQSAAIRPPYHAAVMNRDFFVSFMSQERIIRPGEKYPTRGKHYPTISKNDSRESFSHI